MNWQTVFEFGNAVALGAWLLLAAAPRKPIILSTVLYLGVGLLCALYLSMFVMLIGGHVDPVRDGLAPAFKYNVAGIKALLASEGGVTLAWTHFLAFDLFVGLWIARDADGKGFSRLVQLPFLFLTFMVGPVGLLGWLVVRERRARAIRPR